MNQIQVLLNHLIHIKNYRDESSNISAMTAWRMVTGIEDNIVLHARMNELVRIALKLYSHLMIENEIDGSDADEDWIHEVLQGLSLQGNLHANIDSIHKHTLTIIKSNVRNWNHGYTVHSSLDEDKIIELISKLQDERELIFESNKLSHDLKRVLITEIDKLIYCLENYQTLGEEFTKEVITDFYSEAFFNKDIQEYYKKNQSFKEIIDQISTAITISTFTTPVFANLIESTKNAIQNLS